MFCENCGSKIEYGSNYCVKCGSKIIYQSNATFSTEQSVQPKRGIGKIIKNILIGIGAFFLVCIVIGLLAETDYVDMIKGGTLTRYNYGKTIGDSLDDWFGGNVTWDSYESYGTTYVTATGICPYTGGLYESNQTFTFMIVDDDHFQFLGAYGSDGNEIFSTSTNGWLVDSYVNLYSVLGVDLHESALKAAFGDEESLEALKKM